MLIVDHRVIGALRLGVMTAHQLALALDIKASTVRGSLERLGHQGVVSSRPPYNTTRKRGGPPACVWELKPDQEPQA